MLSLNTIRQQSDLVRASMKNRNDDPSVVDSILALDQENRAVIQELEGLRAQQNQAGKRLSNPEERTPEALEGLRQIRERVRELDADADRLKDELSELLLRVPNLPDSRAPIGP